MDHVEQPRRVLGLVRLELADAVEDDVGVGILERGPFALRLLDPVLAEMALALRDQRDNRVGPLRLAHRHQRDLVCRPLRAPARRRDLRLHLFERGRCLFHDGAL